MPAPADVPLFDTHCHLDDAQFDDDRDGVVARARGAGVEAILAVGTTCALSRVCIDLAARYDLVSAAVGIQPNGCGESSDGDWDHIVALADKPHVVALGETGLDRYWDDTPFDVQQDFFDRHLRLAQQRDLPIIVHMRDCEADTLEMLRAARARGPLRGVMHAFSGSEPGAAECMELGLHVSFAGMVTYKNSIELRQIAAAIPANRILIETDAPYLSPHPKRGQRPNEPARLIHTATCLAEQRGESIASFARQTTENARTLFRLGSGLDL
ncbi:MAG: TatD family hydrolase [Pirellulaceae bacterium]